MSDELLKELVYLAFSICYIENIDISESQYIVEQLIADLLEKQGLLK